MTEQDLNHNWYAVCTRHQHEKTAARILEYKEFEVFLPLYKARHRWKDRIKEVTVPLFPGYLFVREGFKSVESTLRVEPHPFLKSGDWVRVKYGPIAGVEGILLRKKNVARLVLSVEMLGKSAAVEVDATDVERIPAGAPRIDLNLRTRSIPVSTDRRPLVSAARVAPTQTLLAPTP